MADKSNPAIQFHANRYFLELLRQAGFTRQQARKIYDATLSSIATALAAGEVVHIKGFGSLQTRPFHPQAAPGRPDPAPTTVHQRVIFHPSSGLNHLTAELTRQSEKLEKEHLKPPDATIDNLPLEAAPPSTVLAGSVAVIATTTVQDAQESTESTTTLPATEPDLPIAEPPLPDFDTHYHIGIAYKEMGLYDLAIKEFEAALKLANPKQDQQRYCHSCALLSISYCQIGNLSAAQQWLVHGIEIAGNNDDEYKALRYDLGLLYEAQGQLEPALDCFFDVYALDVNFRRVAQKLKSIQSRTMQDKRGERRRQLIPVRIRGINEQGERFSEETLIIDISRCGAGLRTTHALKADSFLEIRFANAQRAKVGKVIWCAPVSGPEGGFQAGVLIQN